MLLQGCHVRRQVAPCQQATVHLGVQGLDTAVQHFRELRDLGHLGHGQASLLQQRRGAAGGQQPDAQRV